MQPSLITVTPLNIAHPGAFNGQIAKCSMLAYAGYDYYWALKLHRSNVEYRPLLSFELPAMHQMIELLTKAVAMDADATFSPRSASHRTSQLLANFRATVPVFDTILTDPIFANIVDQLEISYLGVRYGECSVQSHADLWPQVFQIAELLLADLQVRRSWPFAFM